MNNNVEWEFVKDCSHKLSNDVRCLHTPGLGYIAYLMDRKTVAELHKYGYGGVFEHLKNNSSIYLLIGYSNEVKKVYIGRTDTQRHSIGTDRVVSHDNNKKECYYEDWDTVVVITTKDDHWKQDTTFTLESILIDKLKERSNEKLVCLNGNSGAFVKETDATINNAIMAIDALLGLPSIDLSILGVSDIDCNRLKHDGITDEQIEDIKYMEKAKNIDNILAHATYFNEHIVGDRIYDEVSEYNHTRYLKSNTVTTSEELAKETVQKMRPEQFSGDSKMLVMCSKSGTLAVELLRRFMSDEKDLPINRDDRYSDKLFRLRHLCKNVLYIMCYNGVSHQIAACRFIAEVYKMQHELRMGVHITGNIVDFNIVSLQRELEDIVKKVGVTRFITTLYKTFDMYYEGCENKMLFDAVLSNPPYNRGMELDFIKISSKVAKTGTIITTAKWAIAPDDARTSSECKYSEVRRILNNHVTDIVYYPDCRDIFKIVVHEGIAITTFDNTKENGGLINITNKCDRVPQFNNTMQRDIGNCLSLNNVHYELSKILGLDGTNGLKLSRLNCDGGYVLWAGKYSDWGEVVTTSIDGKTAKRNFDVDGSTLVNQPSEILKRGQVPKYSTYSIVYANDDIVRVESCKSYLDAKLTRFMILGQIYKYGDTLNDATYSYVPMPPNNSFDHVFTDEELYEYFNIPEHIIEIIEKVVKEHKNLVEA